MMNNNSFQLTRDFAVAKVETLDWIRSRVLTMDLLENEKEEKNRKERERGGFREGRRRTVDSPMAFDHSYIITS